MIKDALKAQREMLDIVAADNSAANETKAALCLQSIANSLIDITEQLSVIRTHLQK